MAAVRGWQNVERAVVIAYTVTTIEELIRALYKFSFFVLCSLKARWLMVNLDRGFGGGCS